MDSDIERHMDVIDEPLYDNEPLYDIVCSEEEIITAIAWFLDISDDEYTKGKEFLKNKNRSFEILFNLFSCLLSITKKSGLSGFTYLVEENYVDRIYRDSYYFYFSGKHFNYKRYCKRILLFAGLIDAPLEIDSKSLEKSFAGSIVIRPIPNLSIGRSLLNPRFFLDEQLPCYVRLANYNITTFGKRLSIRAFPYSMQDGETTTCAEITILNLLDYFSQSYPEYRYLLPSEINRIAQENGFERSIPAPGLKYEMIAKTFCEAGFYPRLYSSRKMPLEKFRRTIYYYVESGIPLSLGLVTDSGNGHSVVVVGHGKEHIESDHLKERVYAAHDTESGNVIWISDAADCVDDFCIMNDSQRPYMISNCPAPVNQDSNSRLKMNNNEIEYLMVPLYKKMYLEAGDASDICKRILATNEFGICKADSLGTKDNPIVVRIFMASSRGLRKRRDEQFSNGNEELKSWYNAAVFPKFVWVCELSTIHNYSKEAYGELILDATSAASANVDSLIIAHYPNRIFCRLPEDVVSQGNGPAVFHEIENWTPFPPYDSNLEPICDVPFSP